MAKACAKRSKRIERAVSGDAPPPELDSPPDTESPWSSSRLMSADKWASCSCRKAKRGKYVNIFYVKSLQTWHAKLRKWRSMIILKFVKTDCWRWSEIKNLLALFSLDLSDSAHYAWWTSDMTKFLVKLILRLKIL